jgi:GGDEF domain-containing protein
MMSETRVVYFTGTKTRRAFEQAIAGATVPFTIAYLDLDDFKATNGGGYDKGDAILKAVAAALVRQTRATDTVARVGGDEFAISCLALVATMPTQSWNESTEPSANTSRAASGPLRLNAFLKAPSIWSMAPGG